MASKSMVMSPGLAWSLTQVVLPEAGGPVTIETPWIRRRLELLDFDQGLVVPLGIVERGFKLCRG